MRSLVRRTFAASMLCLLVGAGLLLPATGASAACDQPTLLSPATLVPVSAQTNRVALADLNRDGILDLIACGFTAPSGSAGTSVAVLLGNGSGGAGDGTFGTPSLIAVGTNPAGVAVADFDGDGTPDLVVTSWAGNTVAFLHGLGNGNFSNPISSAAGPGPYEVVAGDFDHDGILDLAVAGNTVRAFSVMRGLGSGGIGNGHFATPVSYPLTGLSLGIAAGDLDLDGNLDLVATENFTGVAVMLGQSPGTFGPAQHYAAGAQPYDVTLHDLDRDGTLDLLVANSSQGGVSVLRGKSGGTFGTAETYALGDNVGGVVAADLDDDAITDLVLSSATRNEVVVLKGGGGGGTWDGTFVLHSRVAVSAYPLGLAAGDLNADGIPDVAVSAYNSSGMASTLLGGCKEPPPDPGAPRLVSVRDVPNDEGGRVFLRWKRSAYDTTGLALITGYRVWRRLPPEAAAAMLRRAGSAGAATLRAVPVRTGAGAAGVEYWEAIAELPAERLAGYGYTAATVQDSMAGSNPFTAFFVTALTSDLAVFYESNVDSGYSVDNVSPPEPAPFVAICNGASTTLRWGSNPAADLLEFRLYRGSDAGFTPGPANLLAATRDTTYVDAAGACHYKLEAVDEHGNHSPVAMVSSGSASAAEPGASELALAGVRPNPSPRGRLSVELVLPSAAPAQLELFDVGGRRLARREVGSLGPGRHTVELSRGLRVPAGRYVIRLSQAGAVRTAGAVVLD